MNLGGRKLLQDKTRLLLIVPGGKASVTIHIGSKALLIVGIMLALTLVAVVAG